MKRTWIFLAGLLFGLSSCHYLEGERVNGDGNITSVTHAISDFKGVDVGGAIELILSQGDSFSVKVVTDQNLHQHLEVTKDGSTLRVHPANHTNLDPTGKIKVYVTAPLLTKIEASGACNVVTETRLTSGEGIDIDLSGACNANLDLKTPNLEVGASGASEISLKGETKNLNIDGSGSTNIKAFDLLSENADVEISGSGDVELYASVKINAHTSGASSIRYKGNATVDIDKSGASSVKKVD